MSVRRAQAEIDSREFTEWMAYATLQPFGDERADLRMALTDCLIANGLRALGGTTKGDPFKLEDFMPFIEKQPKRKEDLASKLRRINAALGGTEVVKG